MCGSEPGSRTPAAGRRIRLLATAAVLLAGLASCAPFELRQILDGPKGKALTINPTSTVVLANGTVDFSADGGVPPYVFSLISGGGTLDSSTGLYTAPLTVGTATIRVTDKTGKGADATVAIQAFASSLTISPAALSLAVGSNVTFSAIGGTPPYTFAIQTAGSGSPTVNATSGLYVAGLTPGTDVIRLTDSASGTVTATVTVTTLTSNVDYTVPATSFPSSGTVSTAIPGGYTFTLRNSGSAAGTQTVDWRVFLSANTVLDGGDMLIASGTATALAAGANSPVSLSGTYPSVTAGSWYLIAQVSAADDTTPANNTSGASPLSLSPQNIDYVVPAVNNTGGTIAGAAMSGTFTIQNIGAAAGVAAVIWDVYASADTVLDGADYIVTRGTQAALGAGMTSAPIPLTGYWPSTPGTWYLLATVAASDDIGPGNNTTPSTAVTTTGPAPGNVDYTVPAVNNTGGTVAGDPLSGNFTVHNGGTDAGAQPVHWTAYLSSNATLEVGTDPVIDSGSTTALAAGATSGSVPFAGTWPSAAGTWRLIVSISASDDTVPGNNVTVSGPATTTAQNVDYTVQSVASTGGTTAGSALAGTLTLRNAGSHAGSQFVPWAVYLSTDATLDVGTDQLVSTGSIAAPGLAAGASSSALPFAGTWPSSNVAHTYYLIASVGAGDDVNSGNNVGVSGVITVNPPNIDYRVPAVTNTGGTTGGAALSGSFTIFNSGTVNGTSSISWTAYLSSNATLEITDQVIATGTSAALNAGSSSGSIPFSGTWPAGTSTWYLIVKVSSTEDVNAANDSTTSSAVAVTAIAPAYTITAVPLPTGSLTGQAVSGTFTIQNTGTAAGTSAVNWQVYASLGDSIYNAGDVLLGSGSIGGLSLGGSSSPGYASTWPSTAGTWYIVVRASAADAPAVADAASGAVAVSDPPPPDYTVSFSAAIPWSGLVGASMNATGTCQITIDNLNGDPGHANVTWAVYLSTDNILDAGDTLVQQGSISALAGGGTQNVGFVGTWPGTPGRFYWLIASVHASDDGTTVNDVVPAPHPSATGDYRYVEGAENNSGVGPTPSPALTSNTGVTTLGANQNIVIEGVMDAFNANDTYRFTTVVSMTKLSMRSMWATGYDDIDLYLWDTSTTDLNSINVGINSEPGNGTFDVTSVTPRQCYVSAYFWLANNTSGSTGQKYVILVRGLP